MNGDKIIKRFLSFSVLSAVGNSCADWAFFFYALDKIGMDHSASEGTLFGLSRAGLFFVGFGLGRMILAPLIGVLFDRFSKKAMSIAIDSCYAALLVLAAVLFGLGQLTDVFFLAVTILINTFSQLHMQSIGFSAVKKHAVEAGGRYLATAFALSNGLGIAVSGAIFSLVGFYGCMAFAVLTFVPVIFTYFSIFDNEPETIQKSSFISDFFESFEFLRRDGVLLRFALVLGVFNIVGAIFPAYLKLEVNNSYAGNDVISSSILAAGLFIAIWFYKHMESLSMRWEGRQSFVVSLAPILGSIILAYFYTNLLTLSILYFSACMGSGLRNIVTARLRTHRVPREKISRVNTVYGSLLNIGPFMGGLLVIPALERSIELGLKVAMAVTFLAMILSVVSLPKEKITELSKETV